MLRDEELVRQTLRGAPRAFNVLVARYQSRLVRFLSHRVGNLHDAEELTQEVFLRAYMALKRFDPAYRFSTWLYRIAINLSIDFLRKQKVIYGQLNPDTPSSLPNPQVQLRGKEKFETFMEVLQSLPADFRLLIEMRHLLDMTYQEMADTLALPLGTVKNRLFRARQALNGTMEQKNV